MLLQCAGLVTSSCARGSSTKGDGRADTEIISPDCTGIHFINHDEIMIFDKHTVTELKGAIEKNLGHAAEAYRT